MIAPFSPGIISIDVGMNPGSRLRAAGRRTTSGPLVFRGGDRVRRGESEVRRRCGGACRRGGDRRRYGEGVRRPLSRVVEDRCRGRGDRGR